MVPPLSQCLPILYPCLSCSTVLLPNLDCGNGRTFAELLPWCVIDGNFKLKSYIFPPLFNKSQFLGSPLLDSLCHHLYQRIVMDTSFVPKVC